MRDSCTRQRSGHTLIELLTVLAIASALTYSGSGSFMRLIASIKLKISINALANTLNLGRQIAWSAGNDVVLCRSRDGRHCQSDARWEDGWVLFSNLDQDEPPEIDSNESVHQSGGPSPGFSIAANRRAFIMRPFGRRATNGTLVWCHRHLNSPGRSLIVSYTGKTRISVARNTQEPDQCAS
jgi:Tfp pilus assembly protein FimT